MMERALFKMAFGRFPKDSFHPSTLELAEYLTARGLIPLARGIWRRWRFKACGSRLLIGQRVRIFFPSQITVGKRVVIGDDVLLQGLSTEGMALGDDVHLRERVQIQASAVLDQPGIGINIGPRTYIGPDCLLGAGGGIQIGCDVLLGAAVHLLAENHRFDQPDQPISAQGILRKGIVVGDNCWIGNKSVILDGVTIGPGCVIGAGSIVTRSLPPGSVAVGNPARILRTRVVDDSAH